MIKVISTFRRRDGLSVEAFQAYWRDRHPAVVLQLPGLCRYVQDHPLPSQYAGGRQPFADGVAETWWADRDALLAQRGTAALAALQADELEFMDPASRATIVSEEVVVVDGAIPRGGGVKVITRLRRRDDLSVADAQAYWRTRHAEVVRGLPGLARYVQDHGRSGPDDRPLIGFATVWFPSAEAARANAASPELATVRADEPNFLDADLPFVVVEAHHII